MKVAVVDAEKPGAGFHSPLGLAFVMDFDEWFERLARRFRHEVGKERIVEHRDNEEDVVGAESPCFRNLVGVSQEVLSEKRGPGAGRLILEAEAHFPQPAQLALKVVRFGDDRYPDRSGGRIRPGDGY